jgi:aspartokinase
MRTISQHVQAIIQETPLLEEIISEGLGNNAAIARSIKKQVERRTLEPVSESAIMMALHRIPKNKKLHTFGFKFLKYITEITVRSDLTLYFVHNMPLEKKIFARLSEFEKDHPESIFGITRGLSETLIVIRGSAIAAIRKMFGSVSSRVQEHVSSITMKLPESSMSVPGVYHPILKALAWEGVNVVELVSAGVELTVFVEDKNVDKSLQVIRRLTRSDTRN